MPDRKNNEPTEKENDVISESIGEYGRWQLQLTFLLSLFNIPCTWHIFAPTFQAAERTIWCSRPDYPNNIDPDSWKNYSQPLGLCSVVDANSLNYSIYNNLSLLNGYPATKLVQCDKWEFEEEGNTLITEFELLCDRKHLINVAEMMFLAGVAAGGLIGGIVSDRYGRKRTLIVAVFLQALLGTIIAFVPWFEMYVVLRAMLGFVSVSVVFSGFVLSVELVGGLWRIVAGVSYMFPVSLSYMSIAGIAWLLRDWRQLQLAISLPGFVFVGLWWILPESPLWLLAMGRTQEVKSILQHAAAVNGKELPHNIDKQLLPASQTQVEPASVLDLFKTPRMRKTTLLLSIIWFVVYLLYYGLVLNLGNIGGDLYINTVLSGAVEIPAIAISILFLLRMGRRWPLALTIMFAGVACFFVLPIPYILDNHQWLVTSLAMIGKFSVSSSNAVIPIFTAELYPTTIRNIGVGASNVTAGIALLLVPYLWELAEMHPSVPMSVLGTCGVIGGLTVLFLPETGNAPLQVTLKEENNEKISDAPYSTFNKQSV